MKDVFEMFRVIMMERKRREIDPTLKLLRESVEEADKVEGKGEAVTRERLANMLEFFELANQWAESSQKVSTSLLVKAARMGDKLFKLLGLAG